MAEEAAEDGLVGETYATGYLLYAEVTLVEQQALCLDDGVVVNPLVGIHSCLFLDDGGEVLGGEVLTLSIEFHFAIFVVVFYNVLMETIEELFVHGGNVLGDAILLAEILETEEECLYHIAKHEETVRGVEVVAYVLYNLEEIVDTLELVGLQGDVLTILVVGNVAKKIGEATFELLVVGWRDDNEESMIVGRELSHAEYMVGGDDGNIMPVEDDVFHVTCCFNLALNGEGYGHKSGGECFAFLGKVTNVVEDHESTLCYF
jgi:hypothetical protein